MSKRIGNIIIIAPEKPQNCELCKKTAELRPFGPNGENICAACYLQNEAVCSPIMKKVLFGD